MKAVSEMAWNAEQVTVKLSEDALERLKEFERRMQVTGYYEANGELLDEIEAKLADRVCGKLDKIEQVILDYRQNQRDLEKTVKRLSKPRSASRFVSLGSIKATRPPKATVHSPILSQVSPRSRTMEDNIKHKLMQAKLKRPPEKKSKARRSRNKLERFYQDLTKK